MKLTIINKLSLKSTIIRRSKPTSNPNYKTRFRVWFGLARCGFVPLLPHLLATAPQPTTAGEPRWSRRNRRQMHPPTFLLCSFDRPPSLFRVVVRVGGDVGRPGLACATAAECRPSAGRPVSCSGGRGAGVGSLPPSRVLSFSFSRQGLRPFYIFCLFLLYFVSFSFFFFWIIIASHRHLIRAYPLVTSIINASLSSTRLIIYSQGSIQ